MKYQWCPWKVEHTQDQGHRDLANTSYHSLNFLSTAPPGICTPGKWDLLYNERSRPHRLPLIPRLPVPPRCSHLQVSLPYSGSNIISRFRPLPYIFHCAVLAQNRAGYCNSLHSLDYVPLGIVKYYSLCLFLAHDIFGAPGHAPVYHGVVVSE